MAGVLLAIVVVALPAHAQRVALVIGNARYQHEAPLRNPVNDARLIETTLRAKPLSFNQVTFVSDANRVQLLAALSAFKRQAQGAEVALLYYSGHGMINSKRHNHVLPTDMPRISANAALDVDTALEAYGVSEDKLIDTIEGAKVQLAILDACRDNGFGGQKSGTKGLTRRADNSRNRLLAYATEEGRTAEDGGGANSTYAASLAKHLVRTDLPVLKVFDEVASDVERRTAARQLPTRSGNLRTDVYLLASLTPQSTGQPVQAPPDPDQEAWEMAKRRDTVAAYRGYLEAFANGRYAASARAALAGLQPATQVPTQQAPAPQVQAPAQPTTSAATVSTPSQTGSTFKDCADCPEMVTIPAGSFMMGSNDGEADEKPVHRVTLRSFALGKFEVTQGQWKALMGSTPSYFKDCGDNCPAENVSWEDAQQFIQKLNQKTGQRYRLPSEAEWEYAARAGCTSAFNVAGQCKDKIEPSEANFDGNQTYNGSAKGVSRNKAVAVGSFAPNGFGLFEMHGNVYEWVQDWHHDNYHGAPTDGNAWENGGEQKNRVLRGGSWVSNPELLRASFRYTYSPSIRFDFTGFRLARSLP